MKGEIKAGILGDRIEFKVDEETTMTIYITELTTLEELKGFISRVEEAKNRKNIKTDNTSILGIDEDKNTIEKVSASAGSWNVEFTNLKLTDESFTFLLNVLNPRF